MKKILLSIAFFLALALTAFAQPGKIKYNQIAPVDRDSVLIGYDGDTIYIRNGQAWYEPSLIPFSDVGGGGSANMNDIITVDSSQAIAALTPDVGQWIYNKEFGNWYEVQADSVAGYVVDTVAVAPTLNGYYAVYQTVIGYIPISHFGITGLLADSTRWRQVLRFAAKTKQSIFVNGGTIYQLPETCIYHFGDTDIDMFGPEENKPVLTTQESQSIRFTSRVDLTKPIPKTYLEYDSLYFIADIVPVRDSAINSDWDDIRASVQLEYYIKVVNGVASVSTKAEATRAGFVTELDVALTEPTEDGLYVITNPGCTWGGGVAWCDFPFEAGLKVMMGTLVRLSGGTWTNYNPKYFVGSTGNISIRNIIFEDFAPFIALPDLGDKVDKNFEVENIECRHIQRVSALETAGTANDSNGEHFYPQRKYEKNTVNSDYLQYPFRAYTFNNLTVKNCLFDNIYFGVVQGQPFTKKVNIDNNICQNSPNVLGFFTTNYDIGYIDETSTTVSNNLFINNRHYHQNGDNRRLAGAHGPNAKFINNRFVKSTGQHMRGNYRNTQFIDNNIEAFVYDTSSLPAMVFLITKLGTSTPGSNNTHIVKGNTIKGGISPYAYLYQGQGNVVFQNNHIDISINQNRVISDTTRTIDRSLIYIVNSEDKIQSLDQYAYIDTATIDEGDYIYFNIRDQSWTKLENGVARSAVIGVSSSDTLIGKFDVQSGYYRGNSLVDASIQYNDYGKTANMDISISNSRLSFNTLNWPAAGWGGIKEIKIKNSDINAGFIPSNPALITTSAAENKVIQNIDFSGNIINLKNEADLYATNVYLTGNTFKDEGFINYFVNVKARDISVVSSNGFESNGRVMNFVKAQNKCEITNNLFQHEYKTDSIPFAQVCLIDLTDAEANISGNSINLIRPYDIDTITTSYQSYLDSISTLGGVQPNLSEQKRVSHYINSISDSISFDLLYNYASTGDTIAKLFSLGDFKQKATAYNEFNFGPKYVVSQSDTSYIGTNFIPASDGINYSLNSAALGIGYTKFSGDRVGVFKLSIVTSSQSGWNRANSTASELVSSSLTSPASLTVTRTDAIEQSLFYNYSLLANTTSASSLPDPGAELFGYSYNRVTSTPNLYSGDGITYFALSEGVPANYQEEYYNALKGAFFNSVYFVNTDSNSSVNMINNSATSLIQPDYLLIGDTPAFINASGNRFNNSYFSVNDLTAPE